MPPARAVRMVVDALATTGAGGPIWPKWPKRRFELRSEPIGRPPVRWGLRENENSGFTAVALTLPNFLDALTRKTKILRKLQGGTSWNLPRPFYSG